MKKDVGTVGACLGGKLEYVMVMDGVVFVQGNDQNYLELVLRPYTATHLQPISADGFIFLNATFERL
uniref:Uncharacterized protein n=1 Tax=Hyaloperonospora arabidopsidis (strain Emoy2) TaxID=559515 RepID=M4BIE7_HYAAE